MARTTWLVGVLLLAGCTAPDVSVSVNVSPRANHEQYLFDVKVSSNGEVLAHPRILVREGQPGEVRVVRTDGAKVVLNVIASAAEEESDR